jgi:DNA-binding transcriptional MerR regulator
MERTIGELARAAADAVTAADLRAASRRVTDLPDERTIRWYATIGLLDRPVGYRGRTALYGERHLLQLLAIKRRQAEGRTLAEIQEELVGAPDRALRRIADLPDGLPHPAAAPPPKGSAAHHGAGRRAFWRERPSDAEAGRLLTALDLGGGAVLTVPGSLDPREIESIRDAARPLIEVLELLDQRRTDRRRTDQGSPS